MNRISYRFLDDAPPADIGFVASGDTLSDCFRAATEATLAAMVANPQTVERRVRRAAHVDNENLELALIKLLDEVVYYKDAEGLFVRGTEVSVRQSGDRWIVEATLEGEAIDRQRHELTGDVKAVTVHRLEVRHTAAGWEATVILDV